MKSAKSINPRKSVIQTIYDIVKTHGGEIRHRLCNREATFLAFPGYESRLIGDITKGGELKVEAKNGEGSDFIIFLPII